MGLRSQEKAMEDQTTKERKRDVKAVGGPAISRNLRDAYFHAVTFAAFANDKGDPEIQEKERVLLLRICRTLCLAECEALRIFSRVQSVINENAYKPILQECLAQFDDSNLFRRVLADFDAVFNLGKGATAKELKGWHDDFIRWLPKKVSAEYLKEESESAAVAKAKEAAARKHKKACQKVGMIKRFNRILDEIAEKFEDCSSVNNDRVNEIGRRLFEIDANLVNVGDELLSAYNAAERYSGRGWAHGKEARQAVWRVISITILLHTARYVNSHSYSPSLDYLLRQCTQYGLAGTLRKFYENYFPDEIEFEE